jgi:hypothetical protein
MAKKQKSKKGKNRRVPEAKKARYWHEAHPVNMVRRYRRILKRFGESEADRFVSLHSAGCGHCKLTLAARIRRA